MRTTRFRKPLTVPFLAIAVAATVGSHCSEKTVTGPEPTVTPVVTARGTVTAAPTS
jgi:hypothetical protein